MGQPKPLVIDVKLSCLLTSCWTSLITDTTNCLKRDFEISIDTQGLRGNYRPHYVLLAISKLGHWRLLKENCFSINIWEWRVYVTQCHRSKLLQKMSCNFFVWSQKTPNTTKKVSCLITVLCVVCNYVCNNHYSGSDWKEWPPFWKMYWDWAQTHEKVKNILSSGGKCIIVQPHRQTEDIYSCLQYKLPQCFGILVKPKIL